MKIVVGGVPEHFNIPIVRAIAEINIKLKDRHEVLWKDYPSGTGALNLALNNGEIDIGFVLTEGGLKNVLENPDILQVDSVYVKSPLSWGIHASRNNSQMNNVSDLDLTTTTFAISRLNSGSHLMSLILAQDFLNYDASNSSSTLKFEMVNDLKGAKIALQKNNGVNDLVFLWEKAMTAPIVKEGVFKRIGVLNTPWPCFILVSRIQSFENSEAKKIYNLLITEIRNQCKRFKNERQASIDFVIKKYGISGDLVEEWFDNLEYFMENSDNEKNYQYLHSTLKQVRDRLDSVKQLSDKAKFCEIDRVLNKEIKFGLSKI